MKIAFLVEYFTPFIFGGSELSSYYLAKGISRKDVSIKVIAPNFKSARNREKINNFEIIRYEFPKKITDGKPVAPFWHTSLLLSLYRTIAIYKICKNEKIDLIHIQEKYLLVAGFIVSKLLGKPLVFTSRDYRVLCNYGFCIKKNRRYKSCNIFEYWTQDFVYFVKNYKYNSSPLVLIASILFALRARLIRNIYKTVAKRVDNIILISKKQQEIYRNNGIKNTNVIYNPTEFKKLVNKNIKEYILYVGKISKGKGVDLLIKSFAIASKNNQNIKLKIVGEGDLLDKCVNIAKKLNVYKNVEFVGRKSQKELEHLYANAIATIVPSRWEEPFGRVALESISFQTPVVVTNVGGLPEIIGNDVTGIVCEPHEEDLAQAIGRIIKNSPRFTRNIREKYPNIKKLFTNDIFNQHLTIYKKLLV